MRRRRRIGEQTLAMVRDLLALCASHVDKEERHVHPAIEARAPAVATRIAEEHGDQATSSWSRCTMRCSPRSHPPR